MSNRPKSRVNRPSAYSQSFGEEEEAQPVAALQAPAKRKAFEGDNLQPKKKKALEKGNSSTTCPHGWLIATEAFYHRPNGVDLLDENIDLPGENDDDTEAAPNDLPLRIVRQFSIYKKSPSNEMVQLDAINNEPMSTRDRYHYCSGFVRSSGEISEDEGQEDDLLVSDIDRYVYMEVGPIECWTFDYTKPNDPFYLRTAHAWYLLELASQEYHKIFSFFVEPLIAAQIALTSPPKSYEAFLRTFIRCTSPSGTRFEASDLANAIPEIQVALSLQNPETRDNLKRRPHIAYVLKNSQMSNPASIRQRRVQGPLRNHIMVTDLDVLKPENQMRTHVTPFVASIAQPYFREDLRVLAGRSNPKSQAEVSQSHTLLQLIKKAFDITTGNKRRAWNGAKNEGRTKYRSQITSGDEIYSVGDVIITLWGDDPAVAIPRPELPNPTESLSSEKRIEDYFWFAKIIYIDIDSFKVHVQWMIHAKYTMQQELANDQTLYLCDICGPLDFNVIVGKADVVHNPPDAAKVASDKYFCSFMHERLTESFISQDTAYLRTVQAMYPPDNCPSCSLVEAENALLDEVPIENGFKFNDHLYHINDFVLFRCPSSEQSKEPADKKPGQLGQIQGFVDGHRAEMNITYVRVRRIGRVNTLDVPTDSFRDERHVFLTDTIVTIPLKNVIQTVFVVSKRSFTGDTTSLDKWKQTAPNHFYYKYKFPTMHPPKWDDHSIPPAGSIPVCHECLEKENLCMNSLGEFVGNASREPWAVLDIFSGTSAFSTSICEGSRDILRTTHAIEISPSASKTINKNFPNVQVYNQCVNSVLQYFVKTHDNHAIVETPCQLYDPKEKVPPPLKPGDVKLLTAGFPCQSHSALTMYRYVDDPKSNLILTALSMVDFLKPEMCFFENVPGFLRYNLMTKQKGPYRTEGGLPMGGFKLLVRILQDMKYQVRFSLLQAGNYGLPQTRVRFFLVAARQGVIMPNIPQPTYDFPIQHHLRIKFPKIGKEIAPIQVANGTALHGRVTVADAILDLARFDCIPTRQWPRRDKKSIFMDPNLAWCGLDSTDAYETKALTSFQKYARQKESPHLQHYTRKTKENKLKKIWTIPISPGADFRDSTGLGEFQLNNPMSSFAKRRYPSGAYSRLGQNGWFNTTITNVDVASKQSRVLHPVDHRILSVRELARSQGFPDWFVFESLTGSAIIMHRQIGNAVPWQIGLAFGREVLLARFKQWQSETAVII